VLMLKKHVRAPKLHLLLDLISKVRQFLRYLISSLETIYIYVGLTADDIERHITYVTSDANFTAKSGQC
jgi:hypothetical protein